MTKKKLKTVGEQIKAGPVDPSSEAPPAIRVEAVDGPTTATDEDRIKAALSEVMADPKTAVLFSMLQETRKETAEELKKIAQVVNQQRQSVEQAIAAPPTMRGGINIQGLLADPMIQGLIKQFMGAGGSDEELIGKEYLEEAKRLKRENDIKKGAILTAMDQALNAGLRLYAMPPDKAKELGLEDE